MPCPFPGMDPYIENRSIWADFHDRLITHICEALQPLLRPRYVALRKDRLFVVESERPVYLDVALVATKTGGTAPIAATTATDAATPVVFEFWREDLTQPLIQIVETATGNRVVSAIEVLSPDNKEAGEGRELYLRKREELWQSGTNLVEIDLLRVGQPTVRLSDEQRATLRPHHYLAAVTRRWPLRHEVYAIALAEALPVVAVPLGVGDADVALDLQAVFTRAWNAGPYPELLRYDSPPPGKMSANNLAWCIERLTAAGFRDPNAPKGEAS